MRPARLSLSLACAAVLVAGVARADDAFVKVIPPGQEKMLGAILGGDALPEHCKLDHASIERTKVVAAYGCGERKATLALHHPADPEAAAPAARTTKFAVVAGADAPRPLVDEIARRLAAEEKAWSWVSAEAPGLGVAPAGPTAPTTASAAFTPEQSEAFMVGVKLFREGQMAQAFERFRDLARTAPENGVLGMVVASLASTTPSPEAVDRFTAEADAHPDDTLAQFVAGVAAHYCGHQRGQTRAEKLAYYERTIKYLSRARPKYDFEPRVYVYLGVSHFRLGHQQEAEQLIEAAVPLAKNDPDVFYCRGEIFQRTNPARSIADIRTYLSMSDALEKQGVQRNQAKHQRVKEMLVHLEAVQRGAAQPEDLFDPLPTAAAASSPALPPQPHRAFTTPGTFGGLALVAGLGGAVAWMLAQRKKRRAGG
jgi:tetratricopeptide (TPR) repeat protein